LDDPVQFVSQVLSLPTLDPQPEARVVINEKAGSIVIGGDVAIGSVVVSHKNVVIETGTSIPDSRFVPIDPSGNSTARLEALVKALNAVKVPTEDIIDIVKGLERNGKLHASLIIE
jgi:flagellar P-ring protein precursor FlgI